MTCFNPRHFDGCTNYYKYVTFDEDYSWEIETAIIKFYQLYTKEHPQ